MVAQPSEPEVGAFRVELNLEVLVFEERAKPEYPGEKNPNQSFPGSQASTSLKYIEMNFSCCIRKVKGMKAKQEE